MHAKPQPNTKKKNQSFLRKAWHDLGSTATKGIKLFEVKANQQGYRTGDTPQYYFIK